MAHSPLVVAGVVRNGVVVPDGNVTLPEGAHVRISVDPSESQASLGAETAPWEAASDEAWQKIDRLEQEDRS